jgi:osmotically inducible protein OsmC
MPRLQREAHVSWDGNLARGSGTITAATGAFEDLPFTLASRVAKPNGKTSPEELLASAHAACYTTSLAGELTAAGFPPEHLDVTATVTLDEVEDGSHRIVGSDVVAQARVPGLDDAELRRIADVADEGCPFSALIKASGRVSVHATLEGGTDGD